MVTLSHPDRGAAREIIVYRDDVHALAFERIEVGGKSRDESLPFSRAHLRDAAPMQYLTSQELHVEMSLTKRPARRLAHECKCLGKDIVERLAFLQSRFELFRFRFESVRGKCLQRRLKAVYLVYRSVERLYLGHSIV